MKILTARIEVTDHAAMDKFVTVGVFDNDRDLADAKRRLELARSRTSRIWFSEEETEINYVTVACAALMKV